MNVLEKFEAALLSEPTVTAAAYAVMDSIDEETYKAGVGPEQREELARRAHSEIVSVVMAVVKKRPELADQARVFYSVAM